MMPSRRSRPTHLPDKPSRYAFDAIGTRWAIDTPTPLSQEVIFAIQQETDSFTAQFSRFEDDSFVSRLARKEGAITFGHGAERMFELYERLYSLTDGRMTPLIGQTLSDLGYDATYSLVPRPTHPTKDYSSLVQRDGTRLTLAEPALLDFGAAGKGLLVDRLATIVARDHAGYTIDGSGDLFTTNEQIIGLEHPDDPTIVIGHVTVNDAALCASATNRRAWGDGLHHIIDPHTGVPIQGIRASWVIARTALEADGLATALFFTDAKKLATAFDFTYVLYRTDGSVEYSQGAGIEIYE